MFEGKPRFRFRLVAAGLLALAATAAGGAPASATPNETVSVSSFSYTGGVPGHTEITLVNVSDAGEVAEFEAIDLFPGCATANPYCTPPDARDAGLFTLSATGTGTGTAHNCGGTWEIVHTGQNPGRWRLIPGQLSFLEAEFNEYCTVSFTATANRLPSVDVNPATAGVQTYFVLDAHAYYNNGPIHSPYNYAQVTVFPGAPAAAPTGQRAAALKKCKRKKGKKRKSCRRRANRLPI